MDSGTVKNVAKKGLKDNFKKQNSAKNTVNVSALWHFVADYLEMLRFTGAVIDVVFSDYLKQLLDYVYSKIKIPESKDIIDEYVVYEFKP